MPQTDWPRANVRLLLVAAIIVAAIWVWALWPSAHGLLVTFIDVGQGDSILIETPKGHVVLVDAGPQGAEPGLDTGSRIVAPLLRSKGIGVIDLLILTHPHEDHFGGMSSIIRQFRVKRFAMPDVACSDDGFKKLRGLIRKRRIPVVDAHMDVQARFPDGVKLTFLYPSSADLSRRITDEELNDVSAVLKVEYKKAEILLAGDAGPEAEQKMLARGADLHADALKVPHHGSSFGTTWSFVKAVHPDIAVVSVGKWNQFGHPSRETLARLRKARVRTYRTDLDGTVALETDGERIRVRQSRKPFWLRGRKG